MKEKEKNKPPASFGEFFRNHLGDSPLSDFKLALRIGVSTSALNGYCAGRNVPSLVVALKFMRYISQTKNVPLSVLIDECMQLAIKYGEIEE